jgi:hypothetical protein
MKRSLIAGVALGLILGATSVATAQPGQGQGRGRFGGGPFGQRGGGLQILRIPTVQQELKMTDAQIAKLDAKQDEVQNGSREAIEAAGGFQALREMSDEDRQKLMAKIGDLQNKAVADVLDANQLKRYKELVLQREGPLAAARKDVAEALKLTEEQRKQIQAIQQGLNQERMQSFQSLGRDAAPEERQKAMLKLEESQAKAGERVLALFNDARKAAWKEMTGAPFKFPAPQRPAA